MSAFLDQAFTMPTAVFSVLLILVGFYWAISLVAGMDLFGGFFEGAEGAVDGMLDGTVEGAVDGVLDGALDGAVDGAADGALDADFDAGHGRGWARMLGLGEVPVTLVLSFIIFFGWVFSFGGTALLPKWVSGLAFLAAGGVGAVLVITTAAIGLSLVATMIALTPLRKMMRFTPATERRELVGRAARVTTQRVDEHFGQAEVLGLDGAPILIQARAALPNTIGRGDQVRIRRYDSQNEVFRVRAILLVPGADDESTGLENG